MNVEELLASRDATAPPVGLSRELQALWHEARGDWDAAHELVQSESGDAAARVHAYLHRKEGDLPNADYWYRRAGAERPEVGLSEEWRQLATALFQDPA